MSDTQPPEIVTDASGRKITLRKLTVVDQARILRAIGPQQSENQPYVQMVEAACMADSIDGVPVLLPRNEAQIDALLTKLGDDGINAMYTVRIAEMQKAVADAQAAAEGGNPTGPLTVLSS